MERGSFAIGIFLVIFLGLGGFLGWHMTWAAVALVTLGVLILWVSTTRRVLDDSVVGPSESLVVTGFGVLVLLAGVWAGMLARPLAAFLNGKTLRFATDLFIR